MNRLLTVLLTITILLTTSIVTSTDIVSDAEAAKGQGVSVSKYGSQTKDLVCGDRLCSEIPGGRQAYEEPDSEFSPTVTQQRMSGDTCNCAGDCNCGIDGTCTCTGEEGPCVCGPSCTCGTDMHSSDGTCSCGSDGTCSCGSDGTCSCGSDGTCSCGSDGTCSCGSDGTCSCGSDGTCSCGSDGTCSMCGQMSHDKSEGHTMKTESGTMTSSQDPGLGHENHQLVLLLPPSDDLYKGMLTYSASQNIQLVVLHGPLAEGEDMGQPIWTPDGETKFALTLVDPQNKAGSWMFAGNALAVHAMNSDPFTVSYSTHYAKVSNNSGMSGTCYCADDCSCDADGMCTCSGEPGACMCGPNCTCGTDGQCQCSSGCSCDIDGNCTCPSNADGMCMCGSDCNCGTDMHGSDGTCSCGSDGTCSCGSDGTCSCGSDGTCSCGSDGTCSCGSDGTCSCGSDGTCSCGSDGTCSCGSDGTCSCGSDGTCSCGSDGTCSCGSDGTCSCGSDGTCSMCGQMSHGTSTGHSMTAVSGTMTSSQDPGLGHENHQLAVLLPPRDNEHSGLLTYTASQNIQLVVLHGPLAEGEDMGQPIWTPDGETKFALTLVDPQNKAGSWMFAGNALAVHAMNSDPFTVSYSMVTMDSSGTMKDGTCECSEDCNCSEDGVCSCAGVDGPCMCGSHCNCGQ